MKRAKAERRTQNLILNIKNTELPSYSYTFKDQQLVTTTIIAWVNGVFQVV